MSLYAAYAFDEGSGSTITDYSGNSRNMTVFGTNSWVTGHGSYAHAFQSGSTSSDGAYYQPGSTISALAGDVTIMVWYKHTATADSNCHAGGLYGSPGFARSALWSYRSLSGTAASPECTVRDSAGNLYSRGANGTHTDTSWHHAAFVYHSTGLMEVYLDGSLVSSGTPTTNAIGSTVSSIGVGGVLSQNGTTEAIVQDLRVFDAALTSSDITTWMNTPVHVTSVTGTGAVTLKKMTAAASGTPKIYGTADVTLKKMTTYGFAEVGHSYNVWGNSLPSGTTSSAVSTRTDSLVFEVTSESELRGIAFYVPTGETNLSGANYTATLYSTTAGTSGTLITSQVGSGTFTAGAWNWISFEHVVLKPGTWYAAAITSPDLLQFVHNYWGTGPGSSGFTSGPIHVPRQADAPGNVQQGFVSGTGFPGSTNSDGSWYGVDIDVFSAPVQTLFGQATPGSTLQSDATAYTLGMEFSLSQDAPLAEIWFYSASGATALPVGCAIFDLDASAVVIGSENDSPTWSGAAGSGWVRCVYDRSTILKAGTKYSVSILKDTTTAVYSQTSHYWDTTGAGASGLTSGIISAPNDVGSVHGQSGFFTGGSLTIPDTSFNASNYWVDVGVVVAPATGITGTGAVTLKKMTAAASGGVKVTGTVSVTLKKMTAAASGGVKVTGTVSVTLKKMTVSGSGVARITGMASVTLKKMTVSGTGHAPLLGTGAVTLKKMTASGSGSVKIIGVGAVTMYKMVAHGTNIPIPKASSLFIFSFR